MFTPLGKTSLYARIQRYVEYFGTDRGYIPIHPKEYLALLDTAEGCKALESWGKLYGVPVYPLGYRG